MVGIAGDGRGKQNTAYKRQGLRQSASHPDQ